MNAAEQHNKAAGEIVKMIVKDPLEAGGDYRSVLVLLESVIVGVVLMIIRLGGDEMTLDLLFEAVRKPLAELRLGKIETKGTA